MMIEKDVDSLVNSFNNELNAFLKSQGFVNPASDFSSMVQNLFHKEVQGPDDEIKEDMLGIIEISSESMYNLRLSDDQISKVLEIWNRVKKPEQ